MRAIASIINKPADISITNVNVRVMVAFVVGTLMHRADAWFESLVAFFG
jgi:hypothetical protein